MAQARKALSRNGKKSSGRRGAARPSVKTYHNYIGGEWVASASGETSENLNPADTRDTVGRFPISTKEDVDRAVEAAMSAYDRWRRTQPK